MYDRPSLGVADNRNCATVTTNVPPSRYLVTLRYPSDPSGKCEPCDSAEDRGFIAVLAIYAQSRESACTEAIASYMADKPPHNVIATAR